MLCNTSWIKMSGFISFWLMLDVGSWLGRVSGMAVVLERLRFSV